jgi:hypothetical protein
MAITRPTFIFAVDRLSLPNTDANTGLWSAGETHAATQRMQEQAGGVVARPAPRPLFTVGHAGRGDYGKTGIKRWIAKRSEGDPLVEAAGMRRTGGLETPAESRAGASHWRREDEQQKSLHRSSLHRSSQDWRGRREERPCIDKRWLPRADRFEWRGVCNATQTSQGFRRPLQRSIADVQSPRRYNEVGNGGSMEPAG